MKTWLLFLIVLVLPCVTVAADNAISVTLKEDLDAEGSDLKVEVTFPSYDVILSDRDEIAKFQRQVELLAWRLEQAQRKFEERAEARKSVRVVEKAAPIYVKEVPNIYPLHVKDTSEKVLVGGSKVRTWVDRSGQFKIEARLAGYDGETVSLDRLGCGGGIICMPRSRLSKRDQEYLGSLQ
jgi:hypothetical protein